MAKTNITTPTGRSKLAARRSPYWHKVQPNRFVGFRLMTASSEGNWIAKAQNGRTAAPQQPLGRLDQFAEEERYGEALKLAMKWFAEVEATGEVSQAAGNRRTLLQVLEEYCLEQGKRTKTGHPDFGDKAKRSIRSVFDLWVAPYKDDKGFIVQRPVARITAHDWAKWLKWMRSQPGQGRGKVGQGRTEASINRNLVSVIAALNLASRRHGVPNVWKNELKKTKVDETPRGDEVYMTIQQRGQLLKAMKAHSLPRVTALHPLALTMCVAPIRPGALAALTVKQYEPKEHCLHIFLGADKVGKARKVYLPEDQRALFKALTKDKLPTAHLFMDELGRRWNPDRWCPAAKYSAKAAGLPEGFTLYWLRHSRITDLVGVPGASAMEIAEVAGTSVKMIEDHYFKVRPELQRQRLTVAGF